MTDWLTNVLAVIGAMWIVCAVALVMFAVACWAAGVMDRNERHRKAARRAQVEQQLADLEWASILLAVDGLQGHPALVGYIARHAAEGIDDEWREFGGVA